MQVVLPIILVALAGIGVALQSPTNAALARAGGSVWLAAVVSFSVGLVALLIGWAIDRTPVAAVRGAPWWMWMGGLYGAWFVAVLAFATPRLGLAVALTITVAAQLTAALVIDRFGLLGLNAQPVTPGRLLGVACVLVGAILVRRG